MNSEHQCETNNMKTQTKSSVVPLALALVSMGLSPWSRPSTWSTNKYVSVLHVVYLYQQHIPLIRTSVCFVPRNLSFVTCRIDLNSQMHKDQFVDAWGLWLLQFCKILNHTKATIISSNCPVYKSVLILTTDIVLSFYRRQHRKIC